VVWFLLLRVPAPERICELGATLLAAGARSAAAYVAAAFTAFVAAFARVVVFMAFPGCCCVCLTGFAGVCTMSLCVELGGGDAWSSGFGVWQCRYAYGEDANCDIVPA
jgi:hypothetical protein